jgi:hypothetical protein
LRPWPPGLDADPLSFVGSFRILQCRLPECGARTDATLDQWYRAVLSEMRQETIPPRRNRLNPRVIKRKMSKWNEKQPHRRRRPPLPKTLVETVVTKT